MAFYVYKFDQSCHISEMLNSASIGIVECAEWCKNDPQCQYFTSYHNSTCDDIHGCQLYSSCAAATETVCTSTTIYKKFEGKRISSTCLKSNFILI